MDGFINRDARDHHVRRCPENKNPTCPKCGLHFVYARIHGHKERCGSWKERTGRKDAKEAADEPTPEASPAKPADAAGLLGVPPERLTETDKEIVPLLAPPDEKPTPPPTSKPETPAEASRADDAAEDHDGAAEPEGGLAGKFLEREPPRTLALAGLGESLKRNWFILAIIAAILAAVVLWRVLSKRAAQQAVSVQQADSPVAYRPVYNPETHGSLEQYLAAFGHLRTQGGA